MERDTLVSRVLVSTKGGDGPRSALVIEGQRGAAISRLDWSDQYPLDANGIPVNYEKVKTGQRRPAIPPERTATAAAADTAITAPLP